MEEHIITLARQQNSEIHKESTHHKLSFSGSGWILCLYIGFDAKPYRGMAVVLKSGGNNSSVFFHCFSSCSFFKELEREIYYEFVLLLLVILQETLVVISFGYGYYPKPYLVTSLQRPGI